MLIRRQCSGKYKPRERSTTHLHLDTTNLQILQYVELDFVIDSLTDLDNVLEAIIAVHYYEEPIIHILPFQTTRADYNSDSDNKNRWWHEKEI